MSCACVTIGASYIACCPQKVGHNDPIRIMVVYGETILEHVYLKKQTNLCFRNDVPLIIPGVIYSCISMWK